MSSSLETLTVRAVKSIGGELRVPGDKSLSHRSVIFAGLADGPSHIRGFLPGEDCLCTLRAMQALGAVVEILSPTELLVTGTGGKLQPPLEPLDCGNSGTAMRLLSGVLAAQPFKSRLFGDPSLSGRPMKRIVDPLLLMGAKIQGQGERHTAPLEIEGGSLHGIAYEMPVASAQLKSCLLLAGLFAQGTTCVTESAASRDHTERLLTHFYAPPIITYQDVKEIMVEERAPHDLFALKGKEREVVIGKKRTVQVRGGTKLHGRNFTVPGDFSSAAFWIVAAAARPGAELTLTHLGLNPTRTGLLSILIRMGAHIQETVDDAQTEPVGNLVVQGAQLKATRIAGSEIPNVIDELPILAVAAALAQGTTEIRDARELRVKETDRIAAMAHNLREFGVEVKEYPDGMDIVGGAKLKNARVRSFGDHRIAMAAAILGLSTKGETLIEDTACIATSYPTFRQDLAKITDIRDSAVTLPFVRAANSLGKVAGVFKHQD